VSGDDRVIVVGAGPVGLVAATYLAREGIPVTVIEAAAELPRDLRASTFHPPTLDMLERFGVTGRLIEAGLICPHWQFRDRREGPIATFDLGLLADVTGHPYRLQCEQWRLAELLLERLRAVPGVEIRLGTSAVGLSQDDAGVELEIALPDGTSGRLRGRYLIGADGARSVVRKAVGVAFEGMTIPEIFLTMSTDFPFETALADLASIAYLSDPEEWLVLLRTRSVWRVLLPTDPAHSEAEMMDPERIEARLQAVVPTGRRYRIVHKTAYRVHERVAARYVVGRVLLAGDAAHLNNPLGGMGMNGGIHDAFNLAARLVEVWHGAPLELLGRYERQRRKVALDVVQQTALRNRAILNSREPEARRAYHDELRRTVSDPASHRAYVLRTSMIQSLRDVEAIQ
jgi:3-(3-hydroxy-phenyl)propionate hydroxylase